MTDKLLSALGASPQSFRAHQRHPLHPYQKRMIDKLTDILEGRIGNQVLMESAIEVKEVLAMLDVRAYRAIAALLQRITQVPSTIARFPETTRPPVQPSA